jgi:hypothetical protein
MFATGIPLTGGFFGVFLLAAVGQGYIGLVVFAIW